MSRVLLVIMAFDYRFTYRMPTFAFFPSTGFNIRAQTLEDLPRRLLVCAVPKSGSTSWHHLMWSLERKRLNMSQDESLYTYNDTLKLINKSLTMDQKDWDRLITTTEGDADFSRDPPGNSSFRVILVSSSLASFSKCFNCRCYFFQGTSSIC